MNRPSSGRPTDPFLVGPGGEKLVTAISLVGSITFRFFVTAMRRPDLAVDPRFSTPAARRANLEALKAVVQAWIYSFSTLAALDAQFDEGKIAIGEVRPLDAIADSEWADYWGATLSVDDRNGGEFRLPGRPWKFSERRIAAACPGRRSRASTTGKSVQNSAWTLPGSMHFKRVGPWWETTRRKLSPMCSGRDRRKLCFSSRDLEIYDFKK